MSFRSVITWSLALIVLTLIGAALARSYIMDSGPEAPVKETTVFVPTVEVLTVGPEPRTLFVNSQGTISSPSRMELAPEISGRVVEVHGHLEEGAYLQAGTELLSIDDADYAWLCRPPAPQSRGWKQAWPSNERPLP